MSRNSPHYDENPFSDNNVSRTSPLISSVGPKLDNPPWLQESTDAQISNGKPSNLGDNTEQSGNSSSEVPRMILYTRVINLILSVCMIIVSLLTLLTTQTATTGVLSCYLVVFACLLCCFETHLKQVSKMIALNFGFMYSAKARSVFMVFIGSILFTFSLFGKIIGCCMLANAVFNIYVLCKFPNYDDIQRTDAQSDIKDFLASNPAFAQQFVSAGVQASAEIIKTNPDLARQGAEAIFSSKLSSGSTRSGIISNNSSNTKSFSEANYTSV